MTHRSSSFQAIGTTWNISVFDTLSDENWKKLLIKIKIRIDDFDKNYSRFKRDSLVSQMSKKGGLFKLPADGRRLLDFYNKLYLATDSKVTPLIGQTVSDAGYDAEYSFNQKSLQLPPIWEKVMSYSESEIRLTQPVLLDFGAAGKGYLVDLLSKIFEGFNLRNYMINAGGDILQRSANKEAVNIGLENPLNTSEAIGIVTLLNRSLCASAGNKRKWGNYHHIIDPQTLNSPKNILATWAVASDTMTSDGLATALFFADANSLMKKFSFSYAVLYEDLTLNHSQNFPANIFNSENHEVNR